MNPMPPKKTGAPLGANTKRGGGGGAGAKTRAKAAAAAGPAEVGLGDFVGTAPEGTSAAAAAERALRLFDLDARWGPCACPTRRERWERAERLGLNPPREVLEWLAVPGVKQEGLWYKRL